MKRLGSRLSITFGFLLGIVLGGIGGFFIYSYVWGAFLSRLGESDQSLLFWYLPFLFIGIFCLAPAIFILVWAYRKLMQPTLKD